MVKEQPLFVHKSTTDKQEYNFFPNRLEFFLDTAEEYEDLEGEKKFLDIKEYGFLMKKSIDQYFMCNESNGGFVVKIIANNGYTNIKPLKEKQAYDLIKKIDEWVNQ